MCARGRTAHPLRQAGVGALVTLVAVAALGPPARATAQVPSGCAATRGSFAFHYSARLSAEELAWLRRFDLVAVGSVLPADQVASLKRSRSRLFLYEWLTGFYLDVRRPPRGAGSWEVYVHRSHGEWLLNHRRPDPGPDNHGRAYYYDPFHRDLELAWAARLARKLRHAAYDGVFFDLAGSPWVPEDLRQIYAARHPDMPYDEALGGFLRSLRHMKPDALLFTNQGYRRAPVYLPLADFDLSESVMTSYAGGAPITVFVDGKGLVETRETFYRPWDEIRQVVDSIAADVARYNPRARIFHLNYVNSLHRPTGQTAVVRGQPYPIVRPEVDRPAIYYGYVAARLWGHESYSPPEGSALVRDEVYFTDLGQPLGASWEERDGLVRRHYEKGIVVLNPSLEGRTSSVASPLLPGDVHDLWDCYEGRAVGGVTVTLEPTTSPAGGRLHPAGRVYLYVR